MYVCLCTGATTQAVADAVASGATTCNQVAAHCGAGLDCGRCRRTVQPSSPLNARGVARSVRSSARAAAAELREGLGVRGRTHQLLRPPVLARRRGGDLPRIGSTMVCLTAMRLGNRPGGKHFGVRANVGQQRVRFAHLPHQAHPVGFLGADPLRGHQQPGGVLPTDQLWQQV